MVAAAAAVDYCGLAIAEPLTMTFGTRWYQLQQRETATWMRFDEVEEVQFSSHQSGVVAARSRQADRFRRHLQNHSEEGALEGPAHPAALVEQRGRVAPQLTEA